jgi:hypothetical protein
MLRLAEFQIRLLLCRPDRKEPLDQYAVIRWRWNCGCSAMPDGHQKYVVDACNYHSALLQQVTEDEERQYDGVVGEDLLIPRAL